MLLPSLMDLDGSAISVLPLPPSSPPADKKDRRESYSARVPDTDERSWRDGAARRRLLSWPTDAREKRKPGHYDLDDDVLPMPTSRWGGKKVHTRQYIRSWGPVFLLVLPLMVFLSLYNEARVAETSSPRIPGRTSRYRGDGIRNNTLLRQGNEELVHQQWDFADPCKGFPNTEGILLVMKTGASEVFDKLPTQLLTSMKCLPDHLIFSDMEAQMGEHHIYDALAGVSASFKAENEDFDLYRSQNDCPVAQKDCLAGKKKLKEAAWTLDKYKFMHILERTWKMRPGKEWYVFAEADTYIFWPNLVEWLRTKADHQTTPFVGSVELMDYLRFAHGGSGYVISGAALKRLVEGNPGLAQRYDAKAREICCGDVLVGMALRDEGVEVKSGFPMFNGEKTSSLPFGPGHWCDPMLTMHHVTSEEVNQLWQFEQTRKRKGTLLMKELYDALVSPHMVPRRSDWDNFSDDVCYIAPSAEIRSRMDEILMSRQRNTYKMSPVEQNAYKSEEACARVCELENSEDIFEETREELGKDFDGQNASPELKKRMRSTKGRPGSRPQCFQWRYQKGVCCISKSFRLGQPSRAIESEERWSSGWKTKEIKEWVSSMGECKQAKWTAPD